MNDVDTGANLLCSSCGAQVAIGEHPPFSTIPCSGCPQILEVPLHFGSLTLVARLGESPLGVVYKSLNDGTPGLVRILCGKVELKREVTAEKLLAAVSPVKFRTQPGFALTTAVVEDEGVFALQRSLVNASVGTRLKEKGIIDRLKVLMIMEQACQLLQIWSEEQEFIVIRPSQLGLDADGRVVLMDIGVNEGLVTHSLVDSKSISKLIPAPYAGKAFLSSNRFDLKGLIYSIAVTTHELLTGKVPCSIDIPKVQLTARSAITPDSSLPMDLRDFLAPLLREESDLTLKLLAEQFKALQTPGTALPRAPAAAPNPAAATAMPATPSPAALPPEGPAVEAGKIAAKESPATTVPKLKIPERDGKSHSFRRGSSEAGTGGTTMVMMALGVGSLCLLAVLFKGKEEPTSVASVQAPAKNKTVVTPPPQKLVNPLVINNKKTGLPVDGLAPPDAMTGGGPQVVKQELVQEEVSLFDRMLSGSGGVDDAPAVVLSAADIPKAYAKLMPVDFQINLLRAECNNIIASLPADRREMETKRFDYLQDVMSKLVKAIRYGSPHKGQFPCGPGKALLGEINNADWSGITVVTSSGEKKISWEQGGLPLLNDLTVWYAQEPLAKGLPDDDVPIEVLAEAARWYANLAVIAAWYGNNDMANAAYHKVKLISSSLAKEIKPMLVRPPELTPAP